MSRFRQVVALLISSKEMLFTLDEVAESPSIATADKEIHKTYACSSSKYADFLLIYAPKNV